MASSKNRNWLAETTFLLQAQTNFIIKAVEYSWIAQLFYLLWKQVVVLNPSSTVHFSFPLDKEIGHICIISFKMGLFNLKNTQNTDSRKILSFTTILSTRYRILRTFIWRIIEISFSETGETRCSGFGVSRS